MEEEISIKLCDPEKIKCRNCIYGLSVGFEEIKCAKFKIKPKSVFYENKDCPKFKALESNVK